MKQKAEPILGEDEKLETKLVNFARARCHERDSQGNDDTFYVVDLGRVKQQHKVWLKHFTRVKPFYAVKCNNDPQIIRTLSELGVNFDCASVNEIRNVLDADVSASRIIYAHPTKPPSHIHFASAVGVDLMTFDNADELAKIQNIHANPRMVLRLSESDPTAGINLDLKFGCSFERARELLRLASQMNIPVVGISFHVGSLSRDPTAFVNGISHAAELFEVGEQFGHDMTILDIGGGYPGIIEDGTFQQSSQIINAALDRCFPEDREVRIIAEPGRFYATTSTAVCTQIIGKKEIFDHQITSKDPHRPSFEYTVNDGMLTSFNNVLIEHEVPRFIPLRKQLSSSQKYDSKIWGRSSRCMDVLRESVQLPELQIGDWLLVPNYGAYVRCIQSAFESWGEIENCYIDRFVEFELETAVVAQNRLRTE